LHIYRREIAKRAHIQKAVEIIERFGQEGKTLSVHLTDPEPCQETGIGIVQCAS